MNELQTVNYNSESMHKLQLAFTVKADFHFYYEKLVKMSMQILNGQFLRWNIVQRFLYNICL